MSVAKTPDTACGPVRSDSYGNAFDNVRIRKLAQQDGQLANQVIKTYPDVSQFWNWEPTDFLLHSVFGCNESLAWSFEEVRGSKHRLQRLAAWCMDRVVGAEKLGRVEGRLLS